MEQGQKHSKPKILLVDCPPDAQGRLVKKGFSAKLGRFGYVHPIAREDSLIALWDESDLPNFNEQEIIFIDMKPMIFHGIQPSSQPPDGAVAQWVSRLRGIVDTRPYSMLLRRDDFDRIMDAGGVCVVFAEPRAEFYCHIGSIKGGYFLQETDEHRRKRGFELDQYCCLTAFTNEGFQVDRDEGTEITPSPNIGAYTSFAAKYLREAEFHCKFRVPSWSAMALNKHQEVVACVGSYAKGAGKIIVLPQIRDKSGAIEDLISIVLPEVSPHLFPHIEGQKWVHRREYEIPSVIEMSDKIKSIEQDAADAVLHLKSEIEKQRSGNSDSYELLRGTGDELKLAVIRSLERIGFKKVIDVDQRLKDSKDSNLREDIQVLDASPALIIDVKGVRGHAEDHEATQAEKHATMRMREWQRFDVQPLTIINHQRHLPPLDRQEPFRKEIRDNAKQTSLGLMTTWDIFKLLRNMSRLNWRSEVVMPIFYRVGRIEPVPEHYREMGLVVKEFPKKGGFGIVPRHQMAEGDTLAVEIDDLFAEFRAISLQVDNKPVRVVAANSNCGVIVGDVAKRIREGMKVYGVTTTV